MFTDAYDVLLLEDSPTVLGKFKTHFPGARVVFSAEPFCWPDVTLAEKYPEVRVIDSPLSPQMATKPKIQTAFCVRAYLTMTLHDYFAGWK